jgi:hypothetical protein
MKRTLSVMTAALFAGALAVPAFAQENPPPAAPEGAASSAMGGGDSGTATPKHHHHGHHHKKADSGTMGGAEASPAATPAP